MPRHTQTTTHRHVRTAMSLAVTTALTLTVAPLLAHAGEKSADRAEEISDITKMSADHISRAFGLSAEDALSRAHEQEKHAGTARDIQAKLGERTSGSFIDQKRGKLVVNVVDDATAKQISGDKVEAKVVKTSRREIETNRRKAEETLGDLAKATSLDTRRNTIVLTVSNKDGDAARKAVEGLDNVEIQTSDDEFEDEASIIAEDTPRTSVYGGQKITFTREAKRFKCSLGFNAQKDGKDVFITAGHCGRGNATFTKNGKKLGVTQEFAYPGHDMAYATLDPAWEGKDAVDKWNGKVVVVKGSTEAPVGTSVCKSGQTTGWTCGTITAKDVTAKYRNKKTGQVARITGLTQTDACSAKGDSGGAWMAGNQAQGVHSGGNGRKIIDPKTRACRHQDGKPNVAYFQPLNPILETYGLTLKIRRN
ncbi:streptogrisin C [Austwickia chelonae]|uniref:Putative peptidase n=2 Tax=Austwickia TaxID=1184606 RepID=K6W5M8_9MICO|nr:putative peptidase [Austwickia chelonae NBRC 105200]SEW03370.1 streptogrisin C [Austwickia chelonae]